MIQENVLQSSAGQMFKQMNVKVAIMQNVEAMIKSYVNALEKAPSTEKVKFLYFHIDFLKNKKLA